MVLSYYDRSEFSNIGNSGYDLKFYLNFGLARETDVFAVIHLEFQEEGPKSTQWITEAGRLHIKDSSDGKCRTQFGDFF